MGSYPLLLPCPSPSLPPSPGVHQGGREGGREGERDGEREREREKVGIGSEVREGGRDSNWRVTSSHPDGLAVFLAARSASASPSPSPAVAKKHLFCFGECLSAFFSSRLDLVLNLSPPFERLLVCAGGSGDIVWLRRLRGHRERAYHTSPAHIPSQDAVELSVRPVSPGANGEVDVTTEDVNAANAKVAADLKKLVTARAALKHRGSVPTDEVEADAIVGFMDHYLPQNSEEARPG